MKLIQFTVTVSDWREFDTTDATIDKLLDEVRARIELTIADVGEEHDIVIVVED